MIWYLMIGIYFSDDNISRFMMFDVDTSVVIRLIFVGTFFIKSKYYFLDNFF